MSPQEWLTDTFFNVTSYFLLKILKLREPDLTCAWYAEISELFHYNSFFYADVLLRGMSWQCVPISGMKVGDYFCTILRRTNG